MFACECNGTLKGAARAHSIQTPDIRAAVQHVACHSCRIPDTARIKEKMMYASSKENLKRKLNGIQVEVQATDASEIEQSVMHEKCMALAG